MYRKGKSFKRTSLTRSRYRKRVQFGHTMYTPREKIQNRTWVFKKGDADDHPSIPHAHAMEHGERLNVWTGDIYPAGSERVKTIGKLKAKELRRLHSDPGFIEFAKDQINWYRNEHPHITFYVPDWFEEKCRMSQLRVKKIDRKDMFYVFVGKAVFK